MEVADRSPKRSIEEIASASGDPPPIREEPRKRSERTIENKNLKKEVCRKKKSKEG